MASNLIMLYVGGRRVDPFVLWVLVSDHKESAVDDVGEDRPSTPFGAGFL